MDVSEPHRRRRSQLVDLWPTLTVVYGLMPWHDDLLTDAEMATYLAQLPEFERLRGWVRKERDGEQPDPHR